MPATATSRNRHIVDQLADVRAQIKALTELETDLKAQVQKAMGSGDSLGGDQFIASQSLQERKGSLDEKAICAALKVEDLNKFRKASTTFVVVRVEPRAMEAA